MWQSNIWQFDSSVPAGHCHQNRPALWHSYRASPAAQAQGSTSIWRENFPFPGGCMRESLDTTRDGIDLRPDLCQGCQARRGPWWWLFTHPAWPSSRMLGWVSPLRFTQSVVHPLSSSCSSKTWGNPLGKVQEEDLNLVGRRGQLGSLHWD